MSFDVERVEFTPDAIIDKCKKYGIASPNRFWIMFDLPDQIREKSGYDDITGVSKSAKEGVPDSVKMSSVDIALSCSGISMPGKAMTPITAHTVGNPYSIPYTQRYEPVNAIFKCSRDLRERKLFDAWQQMIANNAVNSMNFYDEYVRPIHIMQLDNEGVVTHQVTLIDAYPTSVSAIEYSQASKDEIVHFNVVFQYKYWINPELE